MENYEMIDERFKLIKKESVILTPTLAKKLLEINTLPGQRSISTEHLRQIRTEIKDGKFLESTIHIAKVVNPPCEVLINGQHRCTICVIDNVAMRVDIHRYEVPDMFHASELYATFDQPWASRSQRAINKVVASAHNYDWKPEVLNLVSNGGAIYKYGFSAAHKLTRSQRALLIPEFAEEGLFIDRLFHGSYKHLNRVPVGAAIIATYNKRKHTAIAFWESMVEGESLKKTDPRLKLRNYLLSISMKTNGRRATGSEEIYAKCIIAWNAYVKNRATDLKYYQNAELPKPL